jgi:predicted Zn finger-like uncharacterized protein
MRSPMPISIIIACPHCGTRYQVPSDTLGDTGRKVACAHCGQSWLALPGAALPPPPEEDRLFSDAEEAALDRSFEAEEAAHRHIPASLREIMPEGEVPPEVMRSITEIKAALADDEIARSLPKSREQVQAEGKLARRQQRLTNGMPAARFRRMMRVIGLTLLAATVGGGILFRTEIVRLVPDLAGLYAAIGLKVNVVGLDFTDVTTLLSRRGGSDVITVNATIIGVEPRRVLVPPVVVTLYGDNETLLYAWSIAPKVRDLEPGEVIPFTAELAAPPQGVKRVQLSFADSARAAGPEPVVPSQVSTGADAPVTSSSTGAGAPVAKNTAADEFNKEGSPLWPAS